MATRELDPISRIEGHLGAKLTTSGTHPNEVVDDVQVHGNLWRGFENFLLGREPNDAITFTQRICGVCPVPHGTASTFATEAAIGYSTATGQFQTPDMTANADGVPTKAIHVRNVVLGAEFLMSSLTHFYHLAAPSYVQGPAVPPWTPYFADSYYVTQLQSSGKGTAGLVPAPYAANGILPAEHAKGYSKDLWSAVIKQYVKALRIRRLALEAGAIFAGRMPMTSANVAGGVTTWKDETLSTKCTKFRTLMVEIGNFVVKEYIPVALALGALYPSYDNRWNGGQGWGGGCGNFLSWGCFPKAGTAMDAVGQTGNTFKRGYIVDGNNPASTVQTIDAAGVVANLREHITSSHYERGTARALAANIPNDGITAPTSVQRTIPDRDTGYSYLKAPRYAGSPMEVGPLASMVVDGWYPVDSGGGTGNYLRSNANLGPYYTTYVKTLGSTTFKDNVVDFSGGLTQPIVAGAVVSVTSVDLVDDAAGAGTPYVENTDYTVNLGAGTITWIGAGTPTVYVDFTGTVSGLDPAMVGPDLAVALARSSAAKLYIRTASGVVVVADGAVINGLANKQAITDAYTNTGAGALGDVVIIDGATIPLVSWVYNLKGGLSTMDRLRARALQSLRLMVYMVGAPSKAGGVLSWGTGGWITQLSTATGGTFNAKTVPQTVQQGIGAAEAPRGALMHVCTIENGKIKAYQCIVPTTWNGSPRDASGVMGPIEQAIAGKATSAGGMHSWTLSKLPYSTDGGKLYTQAGAGPTTTGGGVEALRVAQSFDPCIACAVH